MMRNTTFAVLQRGEMMDDKLTNKDAITVLRNLQDWLYLSGINGGTSLQREAIDIAIKALEQPKRGRWHYSDGKPARIGLSFGVVCDQCGTESEYCTNFCGECGADMREVTT